MASSKVPFPLNLCVYYTVRFQRNVQRQLLSETTENVRELVCQWICREVSCPGVWLCQDGRVSLTVFALGTSYQTCLLPPVFPLMFKDVFYFKKRFEEMCALNNICCLLKDETIYCELVQWCEDCAAKQCLVLAQYLGALNDVLFPPNVCSNDGVDLLMRRSKNFPGILSPKIEIATKVRIDEVWTQTSNLCASFKKLATCHCTPSDEPNRQKQVCHSARYHRVKCQSQLPRKGRCKSGSRSRSRSKSNTGSNGSCCSLKQSTAVDPCACPKSSSASGRTRVPLCRQYCVYNVQTDSPWQRTSSWKQDSESLSDNDWTRFSDDVQTHITPSEQHYLNEDTMKKTMLESRYIDIDQNHDCITDISKKYYNTRGSPCVCEICKRYHELFHNNQ